MLLNCNVLAVLVKITWVPVEVVVDIVSGGNVMKTICNNIFAFVPRLLALVTTVDTCREGLYQFGSPGQDIRTL